MYRLIPFIILAFTPLTIDAQLHNPDDVLIGDTEVPKVLLVGSFHFGYPGQDAHKTSDENKLDILSPLRQREVDELNLYLKQFQPTKIMIEAGRNTGYLMNRMRKWKKGEANLGRSESHQIGIKLVDALGLDTIYGVDAHGLSYDLARSADSLCFQQLLGDYFEEGPETDNPIDKRYWEWYDLQDELAYKYTLLEYFKDMNSTQSIKRSHGHYVLSDQTTDYNGMDGWFLLNWYSRNLRIIKNIQNIETDSDDRILILFGGGHIPILKQQLDASPEYELVDFNELDDFKIK